MENSLVIDGATVSSAVFFFAFFVAVFFVGLAFLVAFLLFFVFFVVLVFFFTSFAALFVLFAAFGGFAATATTRFFECTANIAPWRSMPVKTQSPPGISIGPCAIVAADLFRQLGGALRVAHQHIRESRSVRSAAVRRAV